MTDKKQLTYRDAGVDIEAGEALVDDIRELVRPTMRPEVLGGIGGFGAVTRIPEKYRKPLLVSGTDGVGTKLRLAIETQNYQGVGIDLVAMCVNDILVSGAEPLFFLDYYASGKLDRTVAAQVIRGIAEGCRQAGCALVGGETAEMPGMYAAGDFDLAGFCVGVVEADAMITGDKVCGGDVLLALPSSGPHSNGYSLIRRILEHSATPLGTRLEDRPLGEHLLAPTRIYVPAVLDLLTKVPVKAMSHITGGGITENLPRTLPKHCSAVIDTASWELPPVFQWIQQAGNVDTDEMRRTFNCGVGYIVVLDAADVAAAQACLSGHDIKSWAIGEIADDSNGLRYR